jgi:diaphanous 1
LRYIKPPDSLLIQLDVYTEEKFEDEEDLRERAENLMKRDAGHQRSNSESEIVYGTLIELAKGHGLQKLVLNILSQLVTTIERDAVLCVDFPQPHPVHNGLR